MVVVQNTAGAARRIQNQKRSDAMRAKKKQREEELKAQVEGWFDKFDVDNSQTLERDELKQLLTHLNPDCPPDESILKLLMSKNRESTAGVITKENVVRTVQKFNTYLRDKETLDRLFEQFDNDRSGVLEPAELLPLLKTWAPAVLASEDDVFFVLEHCDLDGDGMIERSELLPMLAMWKEIALDKELMEMQHKFFDDEGKPISSGGGASRLDTLQDIHSKKQEKGGKSGKVAPEDMAMTSAVPGNTAGSTRREAAEGWLLRTEPAHTAAPTQLRPHSCAHTAAPTQLRPTQLRPHSCAHPRLTGLLVRPATDDSWAVLLCCHHHVALTERPTSERVCRAVLCVQGAGAARRRGAARERR